MCLSEMSSNRKRIARRQFASEERGEPKMTSLSPHCIIVDGGEAVYPTQRSSRRGAKRKPCGAKVAYSVDRQSRLQAHPMPPSSTASMSRTTIISNGGGVEGGMVGRWHTGWSSATRASCGSSAHVGEATVARARRQ
jgi:hypothetical protein